MKSSLLDFNMNIKFMVLFFYRMLLSCDIQTYCKIFVLHFLQKTEIRFQNTIVWYYQGPVYQITGNSGMIFKY